MVGAIGLENGFDERRQNVDAVFQPFPAGLRVEFQRVRRARAKDGQFGDAFPADDEGQDGIAA